MVSKRVFFYVQHLLGIGHLRRAATIANSMAKIGLQVTLVSGGLPVTDLGLEGVHFVQLPPASAADLSFKGLIEPDGNAVTHDWKATRKSRLLDAWRVTNPHALIVELFPFGRRQMRFELIPLLEAANQAAHRPIVISSVRDILGGGQKDPARQNDMAQAFEDYFDHVLVHADPAVMSFGRTFVHADRIQSKLHYTGFVVEQMKRRPASGKAADVGSGEVLVSAGGGAVGMQLLETAIHARRHSKLASRTWRVLAGVNATDAGLAALTGKAQAAGEGRVVVEKARPDFPSLLANCAVSVSQAGYNTMMEIVQSGSRAVVVPFAGGAETEQTLRARAFAEFGLLDMLEEASLTAESLAESIDHAATRARAPKVVIDLEGAARSASLTERWTSELRW